MGTAPTPRPIVADPLKVDPKHYKVEFENDRVRVLRITYGPREKSVIHLPGRQDGRARLDSRPDYAHPSRRTFARESDRQTP